MSRTLVACLLGVAFVIAWLVAAATLADVVRPAGGAALAAFYAVFGVAWVLPVYKLMRWAVRPVAGADGHGDAGPRG